MAWYDIPGHLGKLFSVFRLYSELSELKERLAFASGLREDLMQFQSSMRAVVESSVLKGHISETQVASARPSGTSLLDIRTTHFTEEKDLLCSNLVDYIAHQVRQMPETTFILLLDAGSTILPIFRQICDHPIFLESSSDCSRLKIVTNNLGGVMELLRHGTVGSAARAHTKFDCLITEGAINSTYEACLGPDTHKNVKSLVSSLKKKVTGKSKVLALVTGNYVSTTDGILARGQEHLDVKAAMLKEANESYLVAPMGKMLPCTCSALNTALKDHSRYPDEIKEYGALPSESERKPTLVYTFRPAGYASVTSDQDRTKLQRYFEGLAGQITSRSVARNYAVEQNWAFEVDPFELSMKMRLERQLMKEEFAIASYEFPHRPVAEIMKGKLRAWAHDADVSRLF